MVQECFRRAKYEREGNQLPVISIGPTWMLILEWKPFAIPIVSRFWLSPIHNLEKESSAMDDVKDLWLKFNEYANRLAISLGRTSNIIGEYAEYLAHKHYGGKLLEISGSSADIKTNEGKLYQVKSRKIKDTLSTQLNVIRSWDFDFLVVIIFDENGMVRKALEVPVDVAKEYGVSNSHQNGWVITTTQKFLNDGRSKDITAPLSELNT